MDGSRKLRVSAIVLPLVLLVAFSGCIGTAAQMIYFFKGNKTKAVFPGLKNKRVAVVCISDASSYGPDALTKTVANLMSRTLATNVKKISVIKNSEVENWKDENGWNSVDPTQMGKDLDADFVVTLEMNAYSIHEGSTLFKGRSQITTNVYDIAKDGEVVFSFGPEQFEFPKSHARPKIGTTEAQFEAAYLNRIVAYISRLFYDYDTAESFGEDAVMFE